MNNMTDSYAGNSDLLILTITQDFYRYFVLRSSFVLCSSVPPTTTTTYRVASVLQHRSLEKRFQYIATANGTRSVLSSGYVVANVCLCRRRLWFSNHWWLVHRSPVQHRKYKLCRIYVASDNCGTVIPAYAVVLFASFLNANPWASKMRISPPSFFWISWFPSISSPKR